MPKIRKDNLPALHPLPAVMVSCADKSGRANIITIAWTGVVCSEPLMVSVSVRPGRFSHGMIQDTGQFVINIPDEALLHATDLCGVISGRDADKFEAAHLTPEDASIVTVPMIKECPVNIECKVLHTLHLGTHDLFVGEVVAVHVAESVLDERGKLDLEKARPISYIPFTAEYRTLGKAVGRHGFCVKK